jgi:hypothetical protein
VHHVGFTVLTEIFVRVVVNACSSEPQNGPGPRHFVSPSSWSSLSVTRANCWIRIVTLYISQSLPCGTQHMQTKVQIRLSAAAYKTSNDAENRTSSVMPNGTSNSRPQLQPQESSWQLKAYRLLDICVARKLVYCSYKIFMHHVKARSPVTHGREFEALATYWTRTVALNFASFLIPHE